MRALDMALMNNHNAVAVLLLERGSKGAGPALMGAVQRGDAAIAQAALASPDITRSRTSRGAGRCEAGRERRDHRAD